MTTKGALEPIRRASRADELRGLGILAVDGLRGGIATIRDLHLGIAERAFRSSGAAAAPVRFVHDFVSQGVYAAVRGVGTAVGTVGTAAASITGARSGKPALSASPRGAVAIAALNGAWGDRLDPGLAIEMGFPLGIPEPATPRVLVFLHGLGESERSWRFGRRPPYGDALARDRGFSPLYLRYNTGLPIEENGRRFARLLEELVAEWPVEVEELSFVGHSMGGLVVRAACNEGGDWCDRVGRVVYLGAPHLGAPLEGAAARGAELLARFPETAAIAGVIDSRSAGIKDLRYGYPDMPLLECSGHYCISASLTRDENHPVARVVGDLLVLAASAGGIESERVHMGSMNHFTLLNHPLVAERLDEWLGPRCG